MTYIRKYRTPEGFDNLILYSDGEYLTGLRFEGSENEKGGVPWEDKELPVFDETEKWLDGYFAGNPSEKPPKMNTGNLSGFRKAVTDLVCAIPYGKTAAYGEIAKRIAAQRGLKKMSARAVGGAVGRNPICIIIPCHRVIGSDGSLTGYGGGIENKRQLLIHEHILPK